MLHNILQCITTLVTFKIMFYKLIPNHPGAQNCDSHAGNEYDGDDDNEDEDGNEWRLDGPPHHQGRDQPSYLYMYLCDLYCIFSVFV